MTLTTIDELHANTHAYIKQSQKDFKSYVMKLQKRRRPCKRSCRRIKYKIL